PAAPRHAFDGPFRATSKTDGAAAQATGIAWTALPVLYGYSDFGAVAATPAQRRFTNTLEQFLVLVGRVEDALRTVPDTAWGVAPHSLRAVSPATLTGLLEALGDQSSCPVHLHIAEQRAEVRACEAWSGQRPVAWLLDHAPVDERWCAVHATHMTGEESRALAASGACVALCPTTEANLGDGIFEGGPYVAAGGVWAIGSDSHVSVDAAGELRLLEYSQRLARRERNVLARDADTLGSSGRYLFERAARAGGQACGRRTGVIATGYRGDLICLDHDDPAFVGASGDGWLDRWIFAANRPVVAHVWVGGKQVLEHGQHRAQGRIAERFRQALRTLMDA
ncbi:MAG: amidohydrolase family protein, partial [Pseudomonadota bacterium]